MVCPFRQHDFYFLINKNKIFIWINIKFVSGQIIYMCIRRYLLYQDCMYVMIIVYRIIIITLTSFLLFVSSWLNPYHFTVILIVWPITQQLTKTVGFGPHHHLNHLQGKLYILTITYDKQMPFTVHAYAFTNYTSCVVLCTSYIIQHASSRLL